MCFEGRNTPFWRVRPLGPKPPPNLPTMPSVWVAVVQRGCGPREARVKQCSFKSILQWPWLPTFRTLVHPTFPEENAPPQGDLKLTLWSSLTISLSVFQVASLQHGHSKTNPGAVCFTAIRNSSVLRTFFQEPFAS